MCGANMEEKTISTKAGWGKYTLTIDGINAYVCPECGEITYSYEEMHMLQELGKSLSNLSEEERPDVLNVSEVADLLRVSNQTVYNMIKDGRLKAVKVGREWKFMRKNIESILDQETKLAARNNTGQLSEHDFEIIKKHISNM
ncbi:helix-turn-helix domain-containing protein [Calorimonas adulescens]|uniref:Helix-turn-helix domain-containing protein n=1 Tax=Calorimonas adulescens TaxID=2606906 RepID=A0A5D8QD87_9THEO|nr:helix-turn-helix domain-containing protein [Calorimonas adulescens]